ncbi:MAG: NADP-dependent oxidoreductase [Methanotrichaceae archaeon]|nr:NADP-dependent oxidoreductase [Methanotrichaceae archaeon]
MKAIRIHEFGEAGVLKYEDLPKPEPGPNEIRIQVIAAGVNPVDWKIRKGYIKLPLPLTIGVDVSGVVDSMGAGIVDFNLGDRVFAKVSPGQGGYAEYTIAHASHAALMPRTIGFIEAAAVPTAGLTAWQALFDIARLDRGQSVLIHGAAGGVGSFATQFAKWRGAHVIGTASSHNLQFLKSLGADEVIDYKTQRFENMVPDLDVVLDTVGEDTFDRSWGILKPGGFLVTTVANIPEKTAEAHNVHAKLIVSQASGSQLAQIATIIDDGHVRPIVTEVLPLAEARKAHEMSESRHMRGKIILRVAEDSR